MPLSRMPKSFLYIKAGVQTLFMMRQRTTKMDGERVDMSAEIFDATGLRDHITANNKRKNSRRNYHGIIF